jgi:hypothetical protein
LQRRKNGLRTSGTAIVVAALAVAAGVLALSASAGAAGSTQRGVTVERIKIRGNRSPHFVFPDTVTAGSELKVVNKTDPRKIGPHSFSMVVSHDIPRTSGQIRHCFRPGHICRRVAISWHKFDFSVNPPQPAVNPVEAGADGWDQMGRLDPSRKGDSFFFDSEDQRHKEVVSAAPGTVLHFMCVVHPFMHGKVEVTP